MLYLFINNRETDFPIIIIIYLFLNRNRIDQPDTETRGMMEREKPAERAELYTEILHIFSTNRSRKAEPTPYWDSTRKTPSFHFSSDASILFKCWKFPWTQGNPR